MTALAANPGGWLLLAACRGADPGLFFPEPERGAAAKAKRVCAACPVIAECLAYALKNHERHGVWGGLSERERRHIGRQEPGPRPCVNGHLRTPDNVYPNGSCRKCTLTQTRKSKQKRRTEQAETLRRHMEQALAA